MKWTVDSGQKMLTGLVVNHKNKLKHAGRSGSVHPFKKIITQVYPTTIFGKITVRKTI